MGRDRKLTEQECEILRQNPNVKLATPQRVSLTHQCRTKLYEYLEINGYSATKTRTFLQEMGIDISIFRGTKIIHHLTENVKRHGKPTRGKNEIAYQQPSTYRPTEEDNQYLLATGKFVEVKGGIGFSDDFANELYSQYPTISIEEGIKAAGIDVNRVGYQRIRALKRRFDGVEKNRRDIVYSEEQIAKYKNHPYVKRITTKTFSLKEEFYNEAVKLLPMHIDEILQIFEIEPTILTFSTRNQLSYKLKHREPTGLIVEEVSEQTIRIQRNIMVAIEKKVKQLLEEISEIVPKLDPLQRKQLCQCINDLPKDPGKVFSKRYILSKLKISKSSFYSCLKDENYGTYALKKEQQDEKDIQIISQVIDSAAYPQGIRTIYMRMEKVTGHQFGINKIRRLTHKAGIKCDVRKESNSRKVAKQLLAEHVKDNLLKRTFRLHKPREVFLSDVTYLDFGNGLRGYASVCKDSVTGVVYSFDISESNNLNLVMATLDKVGQIPHSSSALFHTDQGILYLTDTFQNKVKEYGFIQSMSKRGNCWDNAPQESFFGHFKDEVDYKSCTSIEEVRAAASKYIDYYNNDRPQWDLNKMTPVEYESYLDNLSDEEYSLYLQQQQLKYNKMKQRATERAKERAKSLGV